MAFLAYLVLTNLWGANVNLVNVATQIKHLLYVLAFIAASIAIETYYPEKSDRLLLILSGIAACAFLLSILWWYHAHAFPTHRLRDTLGRMHNPILAGCIAGFACLVLLDNLPKHDRQATRAIVGFAFIINLTFIILSQSRTAMAALIPAIAILSIPYLRRRAPMVIMMGVIVAILGFTFQDALTTGLNRNSYRVDIWLATLDKAAASLWWGQGYFCDTVPLELDGRVMRHAHNAYLAAFRDGGLIGLLLLTGFVASAVWHAWRQAQTSNSYLNLALIVFGALAVFFDNDRLVDNPEELWVFFWYPLCRIIAHDLDRDDLRGNYLPAQ
jgi:O-antigen ligase